MNRLAEINAEIDRIFASNALKLLSSKGRRPDDVYVAASARVSELANEGLALVEGDEVAGGVVDRFDALLVEWKGFLEFRQRAIKHQMAPLRDRLGAFEAEADQREAERRDLLAERRRLEEGDE